ncbi:MAG: M12 family metallopeptidase [Oligoflexales bacterium]
MKRSRLIGVTLVALGCKTTSTDQSRFLAELQAKDPTFGQYSNSYYNTVAGEPEIKVLDRETLEDLLEDGTRQDDDNRFLSSGDMVLSGAEVKEVYRDGLDLSATVCGKKKTWPDAVIPYDISAIQDATLKKHIASSASMWGYFGFTWRPRLPSDSAYVVFQTTAEGCWADVGYAPGKRVINLGTDCGYTDVILHEMGHSLGLNHEQVRPDRDNYVTVNMDNVVAGQEHNFTKQGCFDQSIEYDFKSIMHYSSYAFTKRADLMTITKKDGSEIKRSTNLTMSDVNTAKNLYGFAAGTQPGPTQPNGYTNWVPGAPAGPSGESLDCVSIKSSGKWQDTACSDMFPFACRSSTNPKEWKISGAKAPFQNHNGNCPNGFRFSTPKNADENQALTALLSGKTVWMSYNDIVNEGMFTDHSPFE